MSYIHVTMLGQQYARASARQGWGEAAAVAVLLGLEPIAADSRFARHVTRDGVNWDDVLADQSWSAAERFMIATAAGIWRGRGNSVDIAQAGYLDDRFLGPWLAMISAMLLGRVPVGPGAPAVLHVPAAEAVAALASWCADHGLTFAAQRGEA